MSKAYLTIDDGPTKNTKALIDFLISKNITPIMFFDGRQIYKEKENGIYAIQNGTIIGNHSYTHPHFSELNLDECISEIERQEEQIDLLYKDSGLPRKYKLFRFPYGDKGGKNKNALQKYLKKNGFSKIDDTQIKYNMYDENKDYDVFWTFDFNEYKLRYRNGFTYNNILNLIDGGSLFAPNACNIVLIHDHEKTEEVYPKYFYKIINYVLDRGVEFVKPKFITPKN